MTTRRVYDVASARRTASTRPATSGVDGLCEDRETGLGGRPGRLGPDRHGRRRLPQRRIGARGGARREDDEVARAATPAARAAPCDRARRHRRRAPPAAAAARPRLRRTAPGPERPASRRAGLPGSTLPRRRPRRRTRSPSPGRSPRRVAGRRASGGGARARPSRSSGRPSRSRRRRSGASPTRLDGDERDVDRVVALRPQRSRASSRLATGRPGDDDPRHAVSARCAASALRRSPLRRPSAHCAPHAAASRA